MFLIGRALTKIAQDAMPEPPGGHGKYSGSPRTVLVVVSDIAAHPDTAVGEIAARTGLPQSQVSTAVARLKDAGAVRTVRDPADGRRLLVRQAGRTSTRVAEVRASTVDESIASAIGGNRADQQEVLRALEVLMRHLLPERLPDPASPGK